MQYVEPLIAAIAAFLLGFGWYTAMFGKAWQAETGITDEQAQADIGRTHGLAFLMMVLMAIGINFVINAHPEEAQTLQHGAFHGLMTGLLFAAPATGINYLYQKKSLKLWLIDAGYIVSFSTLMGAILAVLKLG